jgi:orotate phosphoribosyltransferase
VVIALDRMERGAGPLSAVQEVRQTYQIPVVSIATLDDLVAYLQQRGAMARELQMVEDYRHLYGVAGHGPS